MDPSYTQFYYKLAHKLAVITLLIGAFHLGVLGATGLNLIEKFFGSLSRFVYMYIALVGLVLALNRDTYLPFLGESVLPCSVLQEQTPAGATYSIQVQVEPLAKVVYWAAEPKEGAVLLDFKGAYKNYENAGVAIADAKGLVTLKVREPQSYKVPMRGELQPHIHFRICSPTGFISRIRTVYLQDGHIEGFTI